MRSDYERGRSRPAVAIGDRGRSSGHPSARRRHVQSSPSHSRPQSQSQSQSHASMVHHSGRKEEATDTSMAISLSSPCALSLLPPAACLHTSPVPFDQACGCLHHPSALPACRPASFTETDPCLISHQLQEFLSELPIESVPHSD